MNNYNNLNNNQNLNSNLNNDDNDRVSMMINNYDDNNKYYDVNEENNQEKDMINIESENINNNLSNEKSKSSIGLKIFLKYILLPVVFIYIIYSFYNNVWHSDKNTNAYIKLANEYISIAKNKVTNDNSFCVDNEETKNIKLSELINGLTTSVSPYGNNLDLDNSYVEIINNNCNYTYLIFLTDGEYSIGTSNKPVSEIELDKTKLINLNR